jgi:hypothetical protein
MPDPFLDIRVHDLGIEPGISGLCAGYENGTWREEQLIDHTFEWLPEFALSPTEIEKMGAHNALAFIRRAAEIIYTTDKYRKRGEFGELFLHIAIRQIFGSIPAISKIYYKDAGNDTVKGFDAVHVVEVDDELELWIGEAKFYKDITSAIRDVVTEIELHTTTNYLRGEFTLLTNKIDDDWSHAEELKKLIHKNTSLDEIFKRACIPVLLTYNSEAITSHTEVTSHYEDEFRQEISKYYEKFQSKELPTSIRIHLMLLPLENKESLVTGLNEKLKQWQSIL